MAISKFTEEEIQRMSMIDLAKNVLAQDKVELHFKDLFKKVVELKNIHVDQQAELLARFYTDLNIDGRFTTLGANLWGLKRWYPVEQTSEKSLAESRKRDLEEAELDELYEEDELDIDEDEDSFEDFEEEEEEI